MFVLIASIAIGYSTPPIGYEYIGVNNHLHTWNQNPLGEDKSNIWFDGRSGYTQFFNGANQSEAIERSEWLTQGFGLGYYDGNNDFQFISQDFLNNPNHNVETDNTTYWQQQVWKCVNNPADFCGGWIRNQSLNSTLLMNAFMFRVRPQDSPFSFPFKLYYLWTFEDINITNTSTVDMIIYCNMTNHNDSYLLNLTTIERCDKIYLNNPSQIIVGNLTQFHIVDSQTLAGHSIFFNYSLNVSLRYQNGRVMLIFPLQTFNNWRGTIIKEMYWIDSVFDEIQEIINPDRTQYQSGYITATSGFAGTTYTSVNNTGMRVGHSIIGFNSIDYRGFASYNISVIPREATIKSVRQELTVSVVSGAVSDWKTDFYGGSYQISEDNNGLWAGGANKGDWSDGTYVNTIDWSNVCPGNAPCTGLFTLPNMETQLQTALNNQSNDWFFTALRDGSDWIAGQKWEVAYHTGLRNQLFVNYTIGYCNSGYYGNETWNFDDNVTCIDEVIVINQTVLMNDYTLFLHNSSITLNDSAHYYQTEEFPIVDNDSYIGGKS